MNKIMKARNVKVGMTVWFREAKDLRQNTQLPGDQLLVVDTVDTTYNDEDEAELTTLTRDKDGFSFKLKANDEVEVLVDSVVAKDDFGWLGDIVEVYEVGREYAIVEYHPKDFQNSKISDESHFASYVQGKRTSQSAGSFDEALALCIAYKLEGPNHHADYYFMKSMRQDI